MSMIVQWMWEEGCTDASGVAYVDEARARANARRVGLPVRTRGEAAKLARERKAA